MNKAAKIVIGIVGLYLTLMLVTGLAAKFLLSGSQIQAVVSSMGASLPVEVKVGEGDFDLVQWFLFRPAVTIQELSVGNPEGFSEQPLLRADGVSAQVALLPLLSRRMEIRSFTLNQPHLVVERNAQGRTNVESLLEQMSKSEEPPAPENAGPAEGGTELSIESLQLNSGTIEYLGAGEAEAPVRLRDINLSLTNFSADRSCQMALRALLFDGTSSQLTFTGNAGPFGATSVPAQGKFALDLAPADVPASIRRAYAGDLLGEPKASSRVALETDMQGDLLGRLQGKGRLVYTDLELGQNPQHRLALSGEAPLDLTVDKPLSAPAFRLVTEQATLQLGEGRWQGKGELAFDGSRFRGGSSGSIGGVQVSEMLAAFTSSTDAIFGLAEIPSYEIQFTGADADEIRNSLDGRAQIRLEEGRIAIFDLLGTIDRHAKKMLTGEEPAAGETNFTRFATDVTVANRRMTFTNLALESAAAVISGQGVVTFDRELQFDLAALVSGALAQSLTRLTGGTSQTVQVPVRVRGTVDSPRVQPDLGRLVKDQVKQQLEERAKGLLDSLFKKTQEPPPPQQ
jgi:AsmA protein